jgi:hypothetical protein
MGTWIQWKGVLLVEAWLDTFVISAGPTQDGDSACQSVSLVDSRAVAAAATAVFVLGKLPIAEKQLSLPEVDTHDVSPSDVFLKSHRRHSDTSRFLDDV